MRIFQTYGESYLEFNNRYQQLDSLNNLSKEEFDDITNNGRRILLSTEVRDCSNDLKEGLHILNKIKEEGNSDFIYNQIQKFYQILYGDFRSNIDFQSFKTAFLRVVSKNQPFSEEFCNVIKNNLPEEDKKMLSSNQQCSPTILFELFQDDYRSFNNGEKTLTFTSLLDLIKNPNLPSHCLDQITFNERISENDRKIIDKELVKNYSLSKNNLKIIINRVFNGLSASEKTNIYKNISKLPVFDEEIKKQLNNLPEIKQITYPSLETVKEQIKNELKEQENKGKFQFK